MSRTRLPRPAGSPGNAGEPTMGDSLARLFRHAVLNRPLQPPLSGHRRPTRQPPPQKRAVSEMKKLLAGAGVTALAVLAVPAAASASPQTAQPKCTVVHDHVSKTDTGHGTPAEW